VIAPHDIIGQVLPVRIASLERYSLLGELAAAAPALAGFSQTTPSQITLAQMTPSQLTTGA